MFSYLWGNETCIESLLCGVSSQIFTCAELYFFKRNSSGWLIRSGNYIVSLFRNKLLWKTVALETINNNEKFFQNRGQNLENTYEGLHFTKVMRTQAETSWNSKHCLKLFFRNLSSFYELFFAFSKVESITKTYIKFLYLQFHLLFLVNWNRWFPPNIKD